MSVSKEVQNRKRKLDESEKQEKEDKKRILNEIFEIRPNLLDLADELLIAIASHLDGESLHNLSRTCQRLKNLVLDKNLWSEAVFESSDLNFWEILKRLKYLTVGTKTLKIRGNAKREDMDKRPLKNRQTFKEIVTRIAQRAPFLEHLHFDKIWFDWTRDFTITKFPANLRSLSLTNCVLPKDRTRAPKTFTNIYEHMPNLEVIRLEYCNFFAPNDLMPLSKCIKLKLLSLKGCKRFRNCVPYISLSCRFGFKNLEVLDLRETNISDSEVQCLNALKNLRELYLEYHEIEPVEEDSDDEEYNPYFRAVRRAQREAEAMRVRDEERRARENQNSQSSQNNTQELNEPQPSTSSAPTPANNPPTQEIDAYSPSSPESIEESLPSGSSSPTEEAPSRTIFIQANISENANQNARLQVIISDEIPHASRYLQLARSRENRVPMSISDRGILAFGVPRSNLIGNLVFLGDQPQPDPNTYLEKIVLKNFRNITDTTLSHLETNAPRLIYLDIRGCPQVTREAVERFRIVRGSCEIVSSFDIEE